jgi:hypothetical protein
MQLKVDRLSRIVANIERQAYGSELNRKPAAVRPKQAQQPRRQHRPFQQQLRQQNVANSIA